MSQLSEDESHVTPKRSKSITSLDSESSSNYDKYLQLATEKNPVMLLELDQDGTIRYLSEMWETIVGPREYGQIADLIIGTQEDKHVFHRAMEMMLVNDSVSYTVTFNVMAKEADVGDGEYQCDTARLITLESCGILIRDSETQLPTHSMWTVKPYDPEWYGEETLADLPAEFVKRLGFGATIFAEYLRLVDYEQCLDSVDLPPPKMELCRVCETFVPAWWLETHAQSCVCEHRIDSYIHLLHDNLVEQAALFQNNPELDKGYKGLPVNINSSSSRSIVDSLKELCEISININPSELRSQKRATTEDLLLNPICLTQDNLEGIYDFSPRSKWNIQNVKSWQLSFKEELDQDPGLALLVRDTIDLAKQKVEALLRLDNAMTYSLRIKNEVNTWVLQLISQHIETNKINLRLFLGYTDSPEPQESSEAHLGKVGSSSAGQEALIPSTALAEGGIVHSSSSSSKPSRNISRSHSRSASQARSRSASSSFAISPKIASPQPQRPRSELFANSYLIADDLPQGDTENVKKENDILRRDNTSGSNVSTTNRTSKSHSRSLTPRQRFDDQHSVFLRNSSGSPLDEAGERTQSRPGSVPSFGALKGDSKNSLTVSKLKSSFSLTPGRSSPLPAALAGGPTSRKSSGSQPRGGADSSGVSSPFANARDYLTPEQHPSVSNLPKQPLSPLLLATNQVKSPAPSIKDYTILKPISKGAYGSVYLARKKLTGDYFAIKALKKSDMISKNQVTNVKSERAIMMVQSDKPYVAPLYASFQNRDNLFLVMEYLPGGDLATLIKMMGYLPEKWTKQYISEVIVGIDDMHQNGIIHHDLKPENLLIDSKGHLKLTDFGLSRAGLVRRHKNISQSKQFSFSNASANQSPISPLMSSNRNHHKRKSSLKHEFSESPSMLSPSTDEVSNRGRDNSESSSQSHGDILALKRSDSQVSFSILNISRSSTPTPPLFDALHSRTNSNTSDKMIDTNSAMDLALFHPEDSKQDKMFFGTPDYLAPETIEGTGEDDACDWWSVGCILFEMLLGYPPFHASTPEEVFKNILAGKIQWPEFSSLVDQKEFESSSSRDLISKLLVLDPTERLGYNGAREIKDHPYFRDVDWDRVYEEEPSFVPAVDNLESTDYFDLRGAVLEDFGPDEDAHDVPMNSENDMTYSPLFQPNDASKRSSGTIANSNDNIVHPQVNKLNITANELESHEGSNLSSPTLKHIPLAIPPHMRDRRVSKLNETQTEFGSFYFRNLSALDKANKDAINRLKNEHSDSPGIHRRTSSASHLSSSSEGSGSKIKAGKVSVSGSPGGNLIGRTSITRAASPCFRASSPERIMSIDISGGLSRKGSGESSSNSSNLYHYQFNDDSPSSAKLKSPISPNGANNALSTLISSSSSASSRTRTTVKSTSQRANSNENFENDRLQAISKVQSMRYRRRSGRKSLGDDDFRYHMDVLVCEPIPIHRYRVSRELEDLGCAVVSVGAGDELISRATSGIKFDLIMTALKLPKLGAADIVTLLKHTSGVNSTTPVVALTNYYHEAVSVNLFNDVLERPVLFDSLKKLIAKYALRKSQQQEETIFSDND
ncbi:ZYBA0S15-00584g1_1 [Zygosaccharomyces bailii CLIB 213]|uniref:non-specific serine/threonine protein kinase n=1 Tax=Zygosaccharomyces bailii (strain CLIB 213 / ATCC 58445 / CBS 680 / BCRC 21525 / NBRC 1098 / NCYC 1416 / NRRL Y-2227) TaxID=1333698 RepID=A0A8J2TCA2_ZYGB2|nr:ZYBA0S15-00584g1_1 [Zygosaccharomyces bailii CLIB 213]